MPVSWVDVNNISFNVLLLLEPFQLSKFPDWVPENELGIALKANPTVEWYLRHKCQQLNPWLDKVISNAGTYYWPNDESVRQAEISVMRSINDLLIYVLDPAIYDTKPFLKWDSDELLALADFKNKTVIDVGAGTGRLTFTVSPLATQVFAVEPVANIRSYLNLKSRNQGRMNVFPVDGTATEMPFPDDFADITMGGHVFGNDLQPEYREMMRVTKPGGMIILCPGTSENETKAHQYLVSQGFQWAAFMAPTEGVKRKYWKVIDKKGS